MNMKVKVEVTFSTFVLVPVLSSDRADTAMNMVENKIHKQLAVNGDIDFGPVYYYCASCDRPIDESMTICAKCEKALQLFHNKNGG